MNKIVKGCYVHLKSSKTKMKVISVSKEAAICEYQENGKTKREPFKTNELLFLSPPDVGIFLLGRKK